MLSGHVEDQKRTAGTVTDETGPDAVVTTLTPVHAELGTLGAHCLAGVNRCDDLSALVARNLEGARPEWLVEQANRAAGDFRESKRDLESAAGIVADAIQRAREAGSSGTSDTETTADTGEPLPDPDERLGAKIKNTERLKSRAARTRAFFQEHGDDVAKDVTNLGQQVHNLMAAKDPAYDMCVGDVQALSYTPAPTPTPDPQQAAGSILDTGVFLVDIVVMISRKGRHRDR